VVPGAAEQGVGARVFPRLHLAQHLLQHLPPLRMAVAHVVDHRHVLEAAPPLRDVGVAGGLGLHRHHLRTQNKYGPKIIPR